MMKKPLWYFEEEPKIAALADYAQRKQCLKTAWAGLKTLPRYQVNIVYPAPWMVAPEQRDAWMDYYLECMGLYQEYPKRVVLWPLDVWLLEHDGPNSANQIFDSNSLSAFLLHEERSDLSDLLVALEKVACLQTSESIVPRAAITLPDSPSLTAEMLQEVIELMHAKTEADLLRGKSIEMQEKINDLELQIMDLKCRPYKSDRQGDKSIELLEAEINRLKDELSQVRTSALESNAGGRDFEAKNRILVEENEKSLKQIFRLQEDLERYFLENKKLKAEVVETTRLMRLAACRIVKH